METHSHGEIAGLIEENWWYVARRHVLEGLFAKFPPTRGTALDLGSGVGANFPVLALHANKIIGLDISQEALDHAQERGYHQTLLACGEQIPLGDAAIDVVLCADVLEHVNDDTLVAEIARVLSKGGMVYVTVPAFQSLWNENDDYGHHLRRYKRGEAAALFAKHGMRVLYNGFWNFSWVAPVWLSARLYRKKADSEKLANNLSRIPTWANRFFLFLASVESGAAGLIPLPVGVSQVVVAQKVDG